MHTLYVQRRRITRRERVRDCIIHFHVYVYASGGGEGARETEPRAERIAEAIKPKRERGTDKFSWTSATVLYTTGLAIYNIIPAVENAVRARGEGEKGHPLALGFTTTPRSVVVIRQLIYDGQPNTHTSCVEIYGRSGATASVSSRKFVSICTRTLSRKQYYNTIMSVYNVARRGRTRRRRSEILLFFISLPLEDRRKFRNLLRLAGIYSSTLLSVHRNSLRPRYI